jgi:hypothetical protein
MNISVFLTGNNSKKFILTTDNIEKYVKTKYRSFGFLIHITFDNGFKSEIYLEPDIARPYEYWIKFCNGEDKFGIDLIDHQYFEINGENIECLTGDTDNCNTVTIPISSGILDLIKEKIEFARAHKLIKD